MGLTAPELNWVGFLLAVPGKNPFPEATVPLVPGSFQCLQTTMASLTTLLLASHLFSL